MKIQNALFAALATGLLAGCLGRADHIRLYLLSTPPPAPARAVESNRVYLVGLRITSAEYLRTRKMIVETGPNQVRLSEENQWQEPPQAGFARALANRFAQNLPDCQLTSMPLATTNTPEFILEIELHSLQGRLAPHREAEVSAEVRLLDAQGRLLERDELRRTSPWNSAAPPDGYAALAAAESLATTALADEIGQIVAARHGKN